MSYQLAVAVSIFLLYLDDARSIEIIPLYLFYSCTYISAGRARIKMEKGTERILCDLVSLPSVSQETMAVDDIAQK